ncbi:DUF6484 domain-containing protein [Caballeronia sp. S22]|jgi:hypothetical protein|uniref:DUF6484 domain-containing protein n=1 Tax=Caballeronia sp. S22 TaxID=3137182 RepID=UPI003530BEFF
MSGRDNLKAEPGALAPQSGHPRPDAAAGFVVGELIGIKDDGMTPIVFIEAHPGAALSARTIVDLCGAHIGAKVAIMFENADPCKPVVVGLIRAPLRPGALRADTGAAEIQLEADGVRLVVAAKERIVLRCGAASITLTHAGKVLIEGEYVLTRSRGSNRIKGASVEIN